MRKALIALMAMALVTAFAMPAAAAEKSEVSFGGYVQFQTFVIDQDEAALDMDADGSWDDGRYDDTTTVWDLDNDCSRFNATFKREDFTAFVEIRPNNGSYFRQWYAEWDFGPGYLLIGHTWVPAFNSISSTCMNAGDLAGQGYSLGTLFTGDPACGPFRTGQIRLRFPFSMGSFMFGALDPTSASGAAFWDGAGGTGTANEFGTAEDDVDYTLPWFQANLNLNFGPVGFNLFGSWSEFEEVYRNQNGDNEPDETEFDIDTWHVGATGKFTAGPFSLALAGWFGENVTMSMVNHPSAARGGAGLLAPIIYDADGDNELDSVHDTDDWGAHINVSFKLNDMVSFAAGGGLMEQDRSDDQVGNNNGDELDVEWSSWYVNATITVAEGFTLTPEVGEYDFGTKTMDGGEPWDLGDTVYYGVFWHMNF
ncbi:MAG: hypothetical protein PVG49_04490 [Desulfobacteraceae bacterium]|jgi:hypothetical protein